MLRECDSWASMSPTGLLLDDEAEDFYASSVNWESREIARIFLERGYGAFGEPTIAVDPHVFRVANRTGLAPGKPPEAVEAALGRIVPTRWKSHGDRQLAGDTRLLQQGLGYTLLTASQMPHGLKKSLKSVFNLD